MAKRPVEDDDDELARVLKAGDRPQRNGREHRLQGSDDDFEDAYEDEYESEEELFEAGVDGRPDKEREAEEKGTWTTPVARWALHQQPSIMC